MIDVGRALVERFGGGRMDVPAAGSARSWIESLMSHLPAAAGCAVVEHLFGVVPLLDAIFTPQGAVAEVASGRKLGALGLFTPAPEPGWEAAAVEGEPSGGGAFLCGEVRLPSSAADGSIVLVRLADAQHRLAWLDHGTRGVERRGSRTGGPVGEGPCWLRIEAALVGPDLLSQPVTLCPGAGLSRCLETYASLWALAAALCAREEVRALRRAVRTTAHRGKAFSSSQPVALGLTEVEIEADLTAGAVRRHLALSPDERASGRGDLAVAAAAARTLGAVAARTQELRDSMGLELDGPSAGGSARTLTAFLGGAPMLESELARALGVSE